MAARVTMLVDQPAPFRTLTIGGSLTYLEKAYDDAKYNRVSAEPVIEAEAGDGRVTAHVQYVPAAGWTDAARQVLGEHVVKKLGEAVPDFPRTVREAHVEAPADLAAAGLSGGHAYHGELTLDQILFMRPVPGMSRYRTPIPGLLLAGSGTHPGGAILGASGLMAAQAALAGGGT
jgi:phytoene dehydrogenase-like protein